jgi:hypothetical protein
MRVASILALVAAAGAAFFWGNPRRFSPAIDPVPWREIGLGLLATGLLLAAGWGFGRRLGQLVLLLATAALPVAGGILVVEGVRGRPLLAMLAALVFTAGLFALLGGRDAGGGGGAVRRLALRRRRGERAPAPGRAVGGPRDLH